MNTGYNNGSKMNNGGSDDAAVAAAVAAAVGGGLGLTTAMPKPVAASPAVAPQDLGGLDEMLRVAVTAALHAVGTIAAKRPASKGVREDDLGPQDMKEYPTWSFWGFTNVRVQNRGPAQAIVSFQAGTAGPETHYIAPGEFLRVARQWAAFPVHISNDSVDPTSTVHLWVW